MAKKKELLGKFEAGPSCFFQDPSIGPTYGYQADHGEFNLEDSIIVDSKTSISSSWG
jgi:hypothetical protein